MTDDTLIRPKPSLLIAGPLTIAWGIAVWLVLQLQHLPSDSLQSICGPWGCGPEMQVLVACHGFWIVIPGPPIVASCWCWNPGRQFRVGFVLAGVGLLTLICVGNWEATHWLPQVQEYQKQFFLRRWMFVIGMMVDVPIVETFLSGVILASCGWWKRRQPGEASTRPNDDRRNSGNPQDHPKTDANRKPE